MVRRLSFMIAAALAFAALSAGEALADKRVALVIGNSAYQRAGKLPNPANDANDVGQALTKLGFSVDVAIDLDKRGMDKAFGKFAKAALGAEAAIFYYSGHGLQFEGHNYVVPVDAKLDDPEDVRYELSRVDDVLADLRNASGVRMLILDACRDNPLAAQLKSRVSASRSGSVSRGLAKMESAEGTMIAYATQAEAVADDGSGRNSPFTGSFLKHVETPGLEIRTLFARVRQDVFNATGKKQLPELSDSVIGEFYLREANAPAAVAVSQPQAPANAAQPSDEGARAWLGIRLQTVDAAAAAAQGAKIVAIDNRGPARPAGLEVNDVVTRYDGKDIGAARDLAARLESTPPGRSVEVVALRGGTEIKRQIVVGRADDVTKATEQAQRTAVQAISGDSGVACDRLTASADDVRRPATLTPVDAKTLDAPLATAACKAATEQKPGEPRYFFGLGRALRVSRDLDGARVAFEKAAAVRYPAAVCALAFARLHGSGFPNKDADAARLIFEDAAGLGDLLCAHRIGLMYSRGELIPQNPAKAAFYFRKAATAGHAPSMVSLGFALQRGFGVPQDFREARHWHEKEPALGNASAKNNLVRYYSEGLGGVRPDPARAAELALDAYKAGNEFTRRWLIEENGRWLTPPAKRIVEQKLFAQGYLKRPPRNEFDGQTVAALEAYLVAK